MSRYTKGRAKAYGGLGKIYLFFDLDVGGSIPWNLDFRAHD